MRPGVLVFAAGVACHAALGTDLHCNTCHIEQAHQQPASAMGRALQLGGNNDLLRSHPVLTTKKGPFTYRIETRGNVSTYSVSDATGVIQVPIHYSFGVHSQTYVLEYKERFYEGLISYYSEIDGLDTTIGDDPLHPHTLLQAFGREIDKPEAAQCFGCHSTGAGDAKTLNLSALTPGVTCDHCHENALLHQKAAQLGKTDFLPKRLEQSTPYQISELCGQCHRTWGTVMRLPIRGPSDVRFQPYRLANSKCFDGEDSRLSCLTCHDPHQKLLPAAALVDTKCLACHASATASTKVCPVAKENCASCHMPKVALPGGHRFFTDHQIRIVKTDGDYPN